MTLGLSLSLLTGAHAQRANNTPAVTPQTLLERAEASLYSAGATLVDFSTELRDKAGRSITAVYILRVVGKILFQAIPNKKFYELHDATWDERFAVGALIFCVAGLGLCPLFFENMIIDAVHPIFDHIIAYVPTLGNL